MVSNLINFNQNEIHNKIENLNTISISMAANISTKRVSDESTSFL